MTLVIGDTHLYKLRRIYTRIENGKKREEKYDYGFQYTIQRLNSDQSAAADIYVQYLAYSITDGKKVYAYDSRKEKAFSNPAVSVQPLLVGRTFHVNLKRHGKIGYMEGKKSLIQSVSEIYTPVKATEQQKLTALKKAQNEVEMMHLNTLLGFRIPFPDYDQELSDGATWKRNEKNYHNIKLNSENQYHCDSINEKQVKITFKGKRLTSAGANVKVLGAKKVDYDFDGTCSGYFALQKQGLWPECARIKASRMDQQKIYLNGPKPVVNMVRESVLVFWLKVDQFEAEFKEK